MSTQLRRGRLTAAHGGMVLFTFAVVAVAWIAFDDYRAQFRDDAAERLATIAEMKANEVAAWRRERISDGRFYINNQAVISLVRRALAPGGDPAAVEALEDLLERMYLNHAYSRIGLFDAEGRERLAVPRNTPVDDEHMQSMRPMLREAATSGTAAFLAFHATPGDHAHLVTVAPVQTGLASVMIWVDAMPALSSVVDTWPVRATTARTEILTKNNDEWLLLSGMVTGLGSGQIPSVPATRNDLPVVRAADAGRGVITADDNGTPVVAATATVGDSPWVLVVTQSVRELYAPLRTRALLIGAIALSVLLAGAVVVVVIRREGQARAAESERRHIESLNDMAQVVAASPVVLFRWQPEGWRVEWVSANISRWGYTPEALMAGTPPSLSLVHPDDLDRVLAESAGHLESGSTEYTQEYRVRRADGSYIWVEDRTTVVRDADGGIVRVEGSLADITDRKQLQAQFVQAQKMETVGRLAGGVAHDFNNLLTVINGYAEFALADMPPDDERREMIQEIYDAGQRASSLTRQLLTFSRRQVVQAVPLDLNTVAEQMQKMLQRLIGEDIRLTFDLDPGLWQVRADAGQLEQVIMNLAVNARDAMPGGGTLVITTRNVEETGSVLLAVADTGCGMDEATQQRLFEPFFTTKKAGQGTGLGLATVYGIVTQAGGRIEVSSAVGHGATFSIHLPRIAGTSTESPAARPVGGLVRGTERILVVEDEEALRRIAVRILEAAGYRIVSAANGPEALALCAQDQEPFDLLLTDVVMPGMNGHELAEALKASRPGMRVIFASGYLHDAFPERARFDADMPFLAKPYSPSSLTAKVRDVLDRT